MESSLWETVAMKPRRPTIKDSTQNIRSEGAKRRARQIAARAARKAAAKKAKSETLAAAHKGLQRSRCPNREGHTRLSATPPFQPPKQLENCFLDFLDLDFHCFS